MIATQKNWVNKTKTWPSTSNNEINLNKLVWKYKKHISLHSAHFILFCLMLNNFILSIKIAKTLRLLLQAIDSRIALQRRNSEYVTLFLPSASLPNAGKIFILFWPEDRLSVRRSEVQTFYSGMTIRQRKLGVRFLINIHTNGRDFSRDIVLEHVKECWQEMRAVVSCFALHTWH